MMQQGALAMILDQKKYDESGVWEQIQCQCDYCGSLFLRSKRNIKAGRNVINKEGCQNKTCTKKKRCESQLIKYGVENAGGTQESQEKAKATWMKNLGVDNPSKHADIRNKIETTCASKYGTKSFLSTESCRLALKEHSLVNYGVQNVAQAEIVKEKIKETCIERYGVSHPRKHERFLEEFCASFLKTHGVEYPSQMPDHLDKRKNTCLSKYGFDHPVKNKEIQDKIRSTCLEKYGKYPVNCYGNTEQEIAHFIRNIGFQCKSDRIILDGLEIDIYIPDKAIAIEYCGLFWHNEMSPCPRNRDYHFSKFKRLLDKKINLITIFEDEWINKEEICKSIISGKLGMYSQRIPARKTQVMEIDKVRATAFLEKHHLQGATTYQTAIGLIHNNELIAVATYGKHHRQEQDCIVISRFCSAQGTQIIGGISKLFSHIKFMVPKRSKIVTWSDNRWGQGDVYSKLGFTLESALPPDYSYYKYGSHAVRKSKQSMKKSNTNCPHGMTEKDWCLENGFVRIWDCGKNRWVYET